MKYLFGSSNRSGNEAIDQGIRKQILKSPISFLKSTMVLEHGFKMCFL